MQMNAKGRRTVIVIPTYNEAKNIRPLLERIFELNIQNLEVIVVDDNSPDGTASIVEDIGKTRPARLIKREKKSGLGSAYIAGFREVLRDGADYILQMDADGSHDPADIPRLLKAAEAADLVIGSRRVTGGKIVGWSRWRHFESASAMRFARWLLSLKTKDVTSGFRCFSRRVLERIPLGQIAASGYAFQEEMLFQTERSGFLVMEVPVTFMDRLEGQSKLSGKDIWEFFIVMMRLWWKS